MLAITFLYLRELNFFCEMEFLLKYVPSFSPAPAAEMETYKYPAGVRWDNLFFPVFLRKTLAYTAWIFSLDISNIICMTVLVM